MIRRRPLLPAIVSWQPPWHLRQAGTSYGDLARRGVRAWLYCYGCCPPGEDGSIDFNSWPWRRDLNYPAYTPFIGPACRRPMQMRVTEPDRLTSGPNLDHLRVGLRP
jgi:hypothetical protein